MKKSVISILLSLVLLLGLCALSVSAAEDTGHVHCVCGGNLTEEAKNVSGHACDSAAITWEAWGDEEAEKTSLPTSGSYYLVAEVTVTSTKTTGDCAISADNTLNLCLNGQSVTGPARVFDVYGTLNVTDCKGTGVVYGNTATKTTTTSSVFYVRAGGAMSLYGGTLQAANETQLTGTGGAGYVAAKSSSKAAAVFHMYGGAIMGGNAKGNGGNIYVDQYTTFNMYGGTVSGGKTAGNGGNFAVLDHATLNVSGGTVTEGEAGNQGGNIRGMGNSTVKISGGTVSNGTATSSGGNIYFAGKDLTVSGGTIEHGFAKDSGNLRVAGTVTISGGSFIGGSSTAQGGSVRIDGGTLNITGGSFTGGGADKAGNVTTTKGGNLAILGGTVTITGGTFSGGQATQEGGNIRSAVALTLSDVAVKNGQSGTNGGNICADGGVTLNGAVISDGIAVGNGGNIYTPEGQVITIENATISGGSAVNGGSIYAGGTFTMTDGTVSGGVATGNGGNIYGLRSVKLNGGVVEGGSAVLGGNIYALRYFVEKTTTDETTGATTVVSTPQNLWVDLKGGSVINGVATQDGGNIYTDGTVTMTTGQLSGGTAARNGGNMYMLNATTTTTVTDSEGTEKVTTATFKTSATISGGTVSNGEASQGGCLYMYGAGLTVSGGEITGGTASTNGGNIAFAGSTVATIKGGTVSGGSANGGGNLFVGVATVTIEGDAVIENGCSKLRGGNIRIDNTKSVVNVKGGQILNGGKNAEGKAVTTYGGNIDVYNGKLNISGGTIADGAAITMGGNIAVENTAVLSITGGGINGGTAPNGGSIAVISTAANAATIENGSISGGTAETNGGNILVDNGAVVTLIGGTVADGIANGGANIHVEEGTLSIDGTTVENGTANARGGNIRVNNTNCYATIVNANISGGSATYGGNLCVFLGGQATVENTTISGGIATTNGGSISVERTAKLTMTDCTVSGGDVTTTSDEMGFGGSIFVDNTASLSITGGSIQGGNSRFGGALAVCSTGGVSVSGTAITSGKGNNGTAIFVAPGCGLTLTDVTVTGSGAGTTIWNRGIITLAGTVEMPDPEFDLMIDCRYGESYIDIQNLTSTGDAPISVRRWAVDSTDDDCGLLAVNATEAQLAMFEARKNEYYQVAYENGTLVLATIHAVHALDAKGAIVLASDSLTEAMSADAVRYVLFASLDGQTISKDILLDLNGWSLTNVTIPADVTVQLIDSATDDFAGVYGSVAGSVAGTVETFVSFGGKTYLVVCENGAYSAHCYDVKLTHVSLDSANDALGYKAQLYGDEIVMKYVTGFGFNLWVDGGSVKTYSKTGSQMLTLRLKNIMAAGGGEMNINATAFVTLSVNGQSSTKESGEHTTSMEQVILAVNSAWAGYSDAQKASVKGLYDAYSTVMDAWFAEGVTNNIKAWAPADTSTEV